ncbi:DUF423 domain-containing protein [Sulfoacidibacillus thermotolerans]|uniref:DUF423 domain-containing protein n=1 Tax=Sulfoacidibacillus thermotolerans TaxID=1765684 RepID=A0A2U3DAH5_SULT2|nr:DUF423 domain-containing protein [Sulfoacidibacillus thermotolerans]PWI58298.1 hypothetical protein BM613_03485 [Sulfoacidibacillus thermotolerans]
MSSSFLILGAVFAFLAVAFGAFGAHALRSRLSDERLAVYQTGVQYQMYHALALLALSVIIPRVADPNLGIFAGRLFVLGIFLFSGSLYVLTLSGKRSFGAITPFGGVAFLLGWVLLVLSALH